MGCVYFNGNTLLAMPGVLEELGLRAGQAVDEAGLCRVIEGNAAAVVSDAILRRIQGKAEEGEDVELQRLFEALRARRAAR